MFKKIEYTAVTAFFGYVIYRLLENASAIIKLGNESGMDQQFTSKGIPFTYPESYYKHFLYPDLINTTVIYLGFLFLNFYVVPEIFYKQKYFQALAFGALTLAVAWITFAITNKMQFAIDFEHSLVRSAWSLYLLGIFLIYSVIKRIVAYYSKKQETLVHDIIQKFLIALVIWLGILIFLLSTNHSGYNDLAPYWGTLVPSFLLILIVNIYWLMPAYENRQQQRDIYLIKLSFITFFVFAPFGLVLLVSTHINPLLFVSLWIIELLLAVPLSWYLYQQNKARIAQLLRLKQELSTTSADLAFLRSQINPHFLFNALNNLYATALQENSERTANGIQKLGDMMRFVLHENHQEKIALASEIEYLANYIDLQQLRTQTSADISIETDLNESIATGLQIAPMLLVPFIENAFKHGISLKEPSHIKVHMQITGHKVIFVVTNSTHANRHHDPEKNKSGIGLNNVKQRLQLIYPNKHQLLITEANNIYNVNLTVDLG